eukprot:gene10990-7822_t
MGMQDGACHDCIIALALVPEEDEDSYSYFIRVLLKNETLNQVLQSPEVVIITDRSKGLIGAISKCLPSAHHRYCAMHLLGNIPRPAFSEQQRQEYFRIVRSKTLMEYDQRMKTATTEGPCGPRASFASVNGANTGATPATAAIAAAASASKPPLPHHNKATTAGMNKAALSVNIPVAGACPSGQGPYVSQPFFGNPNKQICDKSDRALPGAGAGGVLTIAAASTFQIVYDLAQRLDVKKGNSRIQHGSVPGEDTTIEEFFVHRPINESSRPTGYHMDTQTSERRGDPKVFPASTSGPLHSSRNERR